MKSNYEVQNKIVNKEWGNFIPGEFVELDSDAAKTLGRLVEKREPKNGAKLRTPVRVAPRKAAKVVKTK